jgi:hypothetical protein
VELSLSPLFRRAYSSISDAIAQVFQPSRPDHVDEERQAWKQELARLIGRYLPAPQRRKFWLLGTDVVPIPRRFARTLPDRTFVHQPNAVAGNKPVTIGHQYSVLACLPEQTHADDPPWVVPLEVRRLQSDEKATVVGAERLGALLQDETQPFHTALCVHVADSGYSAVEYLGRVGVHRNLVSVTRLAENRVCYRQFSAASADGGSGHPRWYGEPFDLKDSTTWGWPDASAETTFTTKHGRVYQVRLQAWHNLLRRGKRGLPMQRYPFTLIRAVVIDEHGQLVFKRALWLMVLGARRNELSLVEAWQAYGQRYDLEHYFRFGKQRLLMAAYQTPEVGHEENWLELVQLATVQLWLAREVAGMRLRPWERYLPPRASAVASPSQVQRDWEGLIRQIGTPARAPKRRGNAPGRTKGTRVERRQRQSVVMKAQSATPNTS